MCCWVYCWPYFCMFMRAQPFFPLNIAARQGLSKAVESISCHLERFMSRLLCNILSNIFLLAHLFIFFVCLFFPYWEWVYLQVLLNSLRLLSLFHLFFRRLWKHLFSWTSFTASFNAPFQCISLLFKCWAPSKLICLPLLLFYK